MRTLNATQKTYTTILKLNAEVAIEKIALLLSTEGVQYSVTNYRILSTSTPFVLLGIQRRFRTRKNWLGINPFAFISALEVVCESVSEDSTRLTIRIDRLRAMGWVALYALVCFVPITAIQSPARPVLAVVIVCITWLIFVVLIGGFLVKKEILSALT